ncbi:MAG: phosphatidate phosphatase App1 family protein [bacterium]
MRKTAALLLPIIIFTFSCASGIKEDESLVFFPTYGYFSENGIVNLEIHAHIFEPETDSMIRSQFLKQLGKMVGLQKTDEEYSIFDERSRLFMVDNERNKVISIRLGDAIYNLKKSGPNGHSITIIPINPEGLKKDIKPNNFIPFQTVMPTNDKRLFKGEAQLIEPEGISVISDIDDTIKISNVLDKKELVRNTFLRLYRPVQGMSALYQQWASKGVVFHYVSGSPWQLYEPLSDFVQQNNFPQGSFHLKYLRLKDSSVIEFLVSDQEAYKIEHIQNIIGRFPKRRFILVGDSGEKDPEIYTRIAKLYPQQIQAICIRDAGNMEPQQERFINLKEESGSVPWYFFEDGDNLAVSFVWQAGHR